MLTVRATDANELQALAECQVKCFPGSFSTKLGKPYIAKTLEWFLSAPNRFLFHIEDDGVTVGYCGGFVPTKRGDGSSSGMLQFAFNDAIKGLVRNPFLLLHKELRKYYPFIWLNIKRRFTGKIKPIEKGDFQKPFTPYVGLVIIGVLPSYQGKGIAQLLMNEFEERVKQMRQNEIVLSVKKDNAKAIKAYRNFGLQIKEEHSETYVMHKYVA